jgi:hypothetical protein
MIVATLLLVALLAFGCGMLTRSGRATLPTEQGLWLTPARIAALREAYPVAVEGESDTISINPFGSQMVRRADAYVVVDVIEARPEFIHPDPTAVDQEIMAVIANAKGAAAII